MSIELFQRVVLVRDIKEHGLRQGDVATLVDFVPHPANGEMGRLLEVFNALGKSLKVVVIRKSDIEPLQADEVPAMRRLVCAA